MSRRQRSAGGPGVDAVGSAARPDQVVAHGQSLPRHPNHRRNPTHPLTSRGTSPVRGAAGRWSPLGMALRSAGRRVRLSRTSSLAALDVSQSDALECRCHREELPCADRRLREQLGCSDLRRRSSARQRGPGPAAPCRRCVPTGPTRQMSGARSGRGNGDPRSRPAVVDVVVIRARPAARNAVGVGCLARRSRTPA